MSAWAGLPANGRVSCCGPQLLCQALGSWEVETSQLPKAEGVNFIHQVFQGQDTVAGRRQRRLAIDLSEADGPVKASEIRHISTRLAEAYAGKTDNTVSRDLNRLRELKLIERTRDGYRARPDLMLAFLPPARVDEPEDRQ